MLSELNIKNFALIDELNIEFQSGFSVLTGETGAGKSIILDALDILMGARAYKEVIRTEQSSAYIEALFYPDKKEEIDEILSENGVSTEDEMLLISREINQDGRNKGRINGQLVTVSLIQDIAPYLVDIHGQHEQQSLLDEDTHLMILDQYIKNDIKDLKREVEDYFSEIKKVNNKLNNIDIDEQSRARKIDLYQFQIDEISKANLEVGEDESLFKKYKKLSNLEEIYALCGEIESFINAEDYNQQGMMDQVGHYMKDLEEYTEYDDSLADFHQSLKNIYYELQELSFSLDDYISTVEFDKNELSKIEERLDLINRLKRKYGDSIQEILDYKSALEEKLSELKNQEKIIDELQNKLKKLKKQYDKKAKKLSNIRKKEAEKFESDLKNELKDLAMEKARLKVDFKQASRSAEGIDDVKFMISTNPGEDLKPLSKIISGGELSRIMLGFKNIMADIDRVETIVFDEVDKGIGGKTAQKLAEKLYRISNKRQVICVSHLPQVASMGDNHYYINKVTTKEKKTVTNIQKLDKKEIIEELARMLGGVKLTDTTKNHAREMLKMAEEKQQSI
ncbi:MAG TPA: DNA repair protein RecN [Halanaerobiales bacterium]|nr:DNA repair protein RecN [Halanaerobiales bacterium]